MTNRDDSAPHTAKATGRLVPTAVSDQAGCPGSVTVSAKADKRLLARRTVRLRANDGACVYIATITITRKQRGNATRATIATAFPGNDALLETLQFFAGGGGMGIIDGPDEAELQRIVTEFPFTPFSNMDVRVIVDGDIALRQWGEMLAAMAAR